MREAAWISNDDACDLATPPAPQGHTRTLALLLDFGAVVGAVDENAMTPLHEAVRAVKLGECVCWVGWSVAMILRCSYVVRWL